MTPNELAKLLRDAIELIERLNHKGDPICPDCGNVAICPNCDSDIACDSCGHVHCPQCEEELLCPECDADDEGGEPCKKRVRTAVSTGHITCAGDDCDCELGKGHSPFCEIGELLGRLRAAEHASEHAYLSSLPDSPGLAKRKKVAWLKRGMG